MVPAPRLWLLLAIGVIIGLLGAVMPGVEGYVIFYDLALLVVVFLSYALGPKASDLSLRRKFDPVLSVRAPNRIELEISNVGSRPIQATIMDEPPAGVESDLRSWKVALVPGRPIKRSYHITPKERGAAAFGGTFVRMLCPLGLVYRQSLLKTIEPVRVYPNVLAIREFDLLRNRGRLAQMGIRRVRHRGIGTEFESLRDYDQDDFRRIDWKSTARRNRLTVREYEVERSQNVIVMLDVSKTMLAEVQGVRKLDHVLDATLMLLHAALVSGDQAGLCVFGERVRRFVPPARGKGQIATILEAIHDLEAEPVYPDWSKVATALAVREKRRSLIVVFSDADSESMASDMAAALATMRKRHLVLVVRVADPAVLTEPLLEPTSEPNVYNYAAHIWYASQRSKASAILVQAGLRTLEAEPSELGKKLVNAYFELKSSAAI